METQVTQKSNTGWFFSAGVSLCLVQFLGSNLSIWSGNGSSIPAWWLYSIAAGLILLDLTRSGFRLSSLKLSPSGFSTGLVVLLLSDWPARSYNIWLHALTRGEILALTLVSWILFRKRKGVAAIHAILALCIFGLGFVFLNYLGHRLIFSDDHATFLYRLQLLKSQFPVIPFYSPEWNGGFDARDFFATGALNVFALMSPLLYSFPIEKIYNFLIALLLFGVVPLSSYLACWKLDLRGNIPALSALLALASSLTWYRWALSYGTLGFVTTAALFPLCISLIIRILTREQEIGRLEAVLTVLVVTLVVCWTPAGIALLPCIFFSLVKFPKLIKRKHILVMGLALVFLNVPWMTLFWSASNVSRFLEKEHSTAMITGSHNHAEPADSNARTLDAPAAEGIDFSVSLDVLREAAASANPLLFIFLVPGLLLLKSDERLIFGASLAWLLAMGTLAVPLKPQLELDRMLVIFFLCSTIPSACAISSFLTAPDKTRLLSSLTLGALFASTLCIFSVAQNRTVIRFETEGPLVGELTEAVQKYSDSGRVLFSGFMLHEFSGGHLAPLPYFSKTPIVASSHVHNLWKYKQVFPEEFISRKHAGIKEYLDLFNVTAVVAHERKWRDFFRSFPEHYQEVWRYDRFSLFKRTDYRPEYFLEGKGKIVGWDTNSVEIQLDTPDALLKFRHFEFLQAEPCTVSGEQISESVRFLRLSNCPTAQTISIRSQSPLARLHIKGELP